MAVFSNLEGTMSKSFFLGKNGARLNSNGSNLSVTNYQGTLLVPVSAADPSAPTHLVTLQYLTTHAATGALSGISIPDASLGTDGNTYYQVDDTSILQIYFKNGGIWKPFIGTAPTTDSDYVTSVNVQPSEFVQNGSEYTYSLPASVHGRGAEVLVQVQDPTGNTVTTNVVMDGIGNIQISLGAVPDTYLTIKLIGATTMTTPYSNAINQIDWVNTGSAFTLSIPASTHGQEAGPLYLGVYENTVDGAASVAPFTNVEVDSTIDSSGNVVLTSYSDFSGKIVISGK